MSFTSRLSVYRVTGLLMVGLCGTRASAQPGTPPMLTLEQATATALASNRLVQIKTLDVAKADHDVAALKTARRPNIGLRMIDGTLAAPMTFTFKTGAFGTFPTTGPIPSQDSTITTGPRLSGILFAQVAQPLTQLRTIGYGVRALEVGRDLAREGIRAQQQEIVHDVKRLYYGLFEAEGALAANEDALALYRELDRLVSEYVERQVALAGDGLSMKTALAKQEHAGIVLRNTIATLKDQMNLLLGRDLGVDFAIAPPPMTTTFDVDLAAAQAAAIEKRPEVREARLKAQQADYDLRRTKSAAIPEVSLVFSYLGFYNFDVVPRNGAIVGVQATWEPWDWGRKREEAASKEQIREQARLAIKQAEDSVRVDVGETFRKGQEARAMLSVLELSQQAAHEKLRVALEQYRQQATLQRQALEAQAAAAEADQQYRDGLAALWVARADFDKAIGEDQ